MFSHDSFTRTLGKQTSDIDWQSRALASLTSCEDVNAMTECGCWPNKPVVETVHTNEARLESKDTSRAGRQGKFYAYCSNTVVDLHPLPASRVRLTVVEPALSETCLKWQRRSKVPPNAKCFPS